MSTIRVDEESIEDISTRMDLRKPNREALVTIALALSHYYGPMDGTPPYEAVVVSATGVGKTYVLASAMEYLAKVEGIRNFAVITPGRTILEKTVANFTLGHPKSLLGSMHVRPVVVTSDNFDTAATRSAMDDEEQVKLFIFTVQSLTRPNTKLGRRTHEFREGLGDAFYNHLKNLNDLIVFADEHHCYYGPAFSQTIRSLTPKALIGLTATPHSRTPEEQIVYKYPLAAAVADKLVKTPVIVGRKDERNDAMTQLTDGVRLLKLKEQTILSWCSAKNIDPINPVMLVVAQSIADANMYEEIIRSESFMDGKYAGAVLTIHSDSSDEALRLLEEIEETKSPVRIIISVGMLKEGWDVKNIYVLASMRASVSDILTEQTLGRGLRLPFGEYTGIELLDSLEVIAHEKYDDLLRRARIMNEQLVDYRIRLVAVRDDEGIQRVRVERNQVTPTTNMQEVDRTSAFQSLKTNDQRVKTTYVGSNTEFSSSTNVRENGGLFFQPMEEHISHFEKMTEQVQDMRSKDGLGKLYVPVLRTKKVDSPFSLADITDMEIFRQLGRKFRQTPDEALRRERVRARIVTDSTGLRRTEIYTEQSHDTIYSQGVLLPLELLVNHLVDAVMHSEIAPERASEIKAAQNLVHALVEGMGEEAHGILSGYFDTIRARFVEAVIDTASHYARPAQIIEAIELRNFAPTRMTRPNPALDRHGEFQPRHPYIGWEKSMYEQAWFDSKPERELANIMDSSEDIQFWVRLHNGDLPILWNAKDNSYNPDFIAEEVDKTHWIIEVKSDRDMSTSEVTEKKVAASRWTNHANLDPRVEGKWRYLLVSERALRESHGSWRMIKTLGDTSD